MDRTGDSRCPSEPAGLTESPAPEGRKQLGFSRSGHAVCTEHDPCPEGETEVGRNEDGSRICQPPDIDGPETPADGACLLLQLLYDPDTVTEGRRFPCG